MEIVSSSVESDGFHKLLHYLQKSIIFCELSLFDVIKIIISLNKSFKEKTVLALPFSLLRKLEKITTPEQMLAILNVKKASKSVFEDLIFLLRTIKHQISLPICVEITETILPQYPRNTWQNGEFLISEPCDQCGVLMILPRTYHFRESPQFCYGCNEKVWNSWCISNKTCSIYGCETTHSKDKIQQPFIIGPKIIFFSGACVRCSP